MLFLACIARPRLTPNLVLMGSRTTTPDLHAISDLKSSRACARASRWRHGGVRRRATCWASRRCIGGVLAIQRVDGPSLAMSTHPSNSSSFLGQLFGSSVGAMSQTTGVFRDSPRARRRAGGGLRRSSLAAALGQDSSTRRCSGTLMMSSLWVGSQAKRLRVRVRGSRLRGGGSLFFPAHRCVTSASSPLGRGGVPQNREPDSRKTRRLN